MNSDELYNDEIEDFDEEDDDQPNLDDLIEKYRFAEVDYEDWHDFVLEDWKEQLEELGYIDAEIEYTGFWSQGDGASFTSGYDINKYIERNKPKIIQLCFPHIQDGIDDLNNYLSIYVEKISHHYAHWNTCSLRVDVECEPESIPEKKFNAFADDLEKELEEERKNLCRQIYQSLEAEYDYLTSDEAVKEYLISNELWEEPEKEIKQAA